jgi:ATP-dependent DNA ligase
VLASFNALQQQRTNRHLQFCAFDVRVYRGRSLVNVPLEARRGLLETVRCEGFFLRSNALCLGGNFGGTGQILN